MSEDTVKITYIGGPTALLELGGLRFVTDPTFDMAPAEYASGASALHKTESPAISAESLGHLDAVLLSHDHHPDNLDNAGRLFLKQADKVLTTTAGARRLCGNAVALDTWQSIELRSPNGAVVKVIATPARHGPAHMDRGPVVGFLLRSNGDSIYISGDTVWYEGVEEVARRSVKTAILHLGAARVEAVGPWNLTN
jgi:L-ascorbate metabolism protein UlaG (beta-lactamase superfamily)